MTLPFIFGTLPGGNTPASDLDTNFAVLEGAIVQPITSTGTANSYVLTPVDPWVTGYSLYKGNVLSVIFNVSNTNSVSVNVSGLGAVAVYKNIGGNPTQLVASDIYANVPYLLTCDGTNFWLTNVTSTATLPFLHETAYLSSTNFIPAAGVSRVFTRVWAGGGGGGGVAAANAVGAGGGGGGAYAEGYVDVTPGVACAIVVGAAGTAGAAGNNNGGTGGTSSFAGTSVTVTAAGGVGGTGSGAFGGAAGGAGGTASNGDVDLAGAPGQFGWGATGNGNSQGGGGGNSPQGGAGSAIRFFAAQGSGAGNPANFPGGGGGGAVTSGGTQAGAAGGAGLVVVSYP